MANIDEAWIAKFHCGQKEFFRGQNYEIVFKPKCKEIKGERFIVLECDGDCT